MKPLQEQVRTRCVYYNGLQHEHCKAGIEYESVRPESRSQSWPCVVQVGRELGSCPKQRFPTDGEVAAEVAETKGKMRSTLRVLSDVFTDAKSKGYRKGHGGQGVIRCSKCNTGDLEYVVTDHSGQVWVKCSTDGCIAWMP